MSKPTKFRTDRGLRGIAFHEEGGRDCALQESSCATKRALWLGLDTRRMLLTPAMCKMLVPYLQEFAETGELASIQVPRNG